MGTGFVAGVAVGVLVTAALNVLRRRRSQPLDTLTGIPTRAAVVDALRRVVTGDAVVMVDLDSLKATNDTSGHAAGDDVLRSLAAHLCNGLRNDDVVGRWGGDEFVLVLRGVGATASDVVERLRRSAPTSFSAGIAVHDGGPGDATLARADAALLAAKRAGGERVVTQ